MSKYTNSISSQTTVGSTTVTASDSQDFYVLDTSTLLITKEISSSGSQDDYYVSGDIITFKITVTSDGNLTGVTVTDIVPSIVTSITATQDHTEGSITIDTSDTTKTTVTVTGLELVDSKKVAIITITGTIM